MSATQPPAGGPIQRSRSTRIAAYGLLVDDGRIMLCRLSSQLPFAAGWWTLPGGGIDFGEDPADAVVRELREETGLEVRVERLVAVDSEAFAWEERDQHQVRIIYRVVAIGGALSFEPEGTTDMCAYIHPDVASAMPLVPLARLGLDLAFVQP